MALLVALRKRLMASASESCGQIEWTTEAAVKLFACFPQGLTARQDALHFLRGAVVGKPRAAHCEPKLQPRVADVAGRKMGYFKKSKRDLMASHNLLPKQTGPLGPTLSSRSYGHLQLKARCLLADRGPRGLGEEMLSRARLRRPVEACAAAGRASAPAEPNKH